MTEHDNNIIKLIEDNNNMCDGKAKWYKVAIVDADEWNRLSSV